MDDKSPLKDTKSKNNTVSLIIAAILVLVFTGLVGFISYQFGKSAGERTAAESDETSSSPTVTSETTNAYEGWKVFNGKSGISFNYPSDWEVEENLNSEEPLFFSISVKDNSGYEIKFYLDEDLFSYYCIYSDTDTSLIPNNNNSSLNRTFQEYMEISNDNVSYRRGIYEYDDWTENVICEKQPSGLYKVETYIDYIFPPEPETKKIEILDKILLSAKWDW